jgi:hypothetical protein
MKSLRVQGLRANLTVTAILLNGKRFTRRLRTPPKKYLKPEGVEAVLAEEASRVEQFFPDREFRLVPLRDGNFNFVEVAPQSAHA